MEDLHAALVVRFRELSERLSAERAEQARTTTSEELLVVAAQSQDPIVQLALLTNSEITDATFKAIETEDAEVEIAMAQHPGCPPAVLERLALSPDVRVRLLVRKHHRSTALAIWWELLTPSELEQLPPPGPSDDTVTDDMLDPSKGAGTLYHEHLEETSSGIWELRRELVATRHPRLPGYVQGRVLAKVLSRLLKRRSIEEVWDHAARTVRVRPPSELGALLEVAKRLAQHPRTTKTQLRKLGELRQAVVNEALAKNPNTPLPNLRRMVEIQDDGVRIAVASHRSKHVQSLEKWLLDANEPVVMAYARNPFARYWTLQNLIRTPPSHDVLVATAGNRSLRENDLEHLTQLGDERIDARVARSPAAPPALLRELAGRSTPSIVSALAKNASTPPDILAAIVAGDAEDMTVQWALANPATPRETRELALKALTTACGLAHNPTVDIDHQIILSRCFDLQTLLNLAGNAVATDEALQQVIDTTHDLIVDFDHAPEESDPAVPSESREILRRVAAHANTPTDQLEELSTNHDPLISLTARLTLIDRT